MHFAREARQGVTWLLRRACCAGGKGEGKGSLKQALLQGAAAPRHGCGAEQDEQRAQTAAGTPGSHAHDDGEGQGVLACVTTRAGEGRCRGEAAAGAGAAGEGAGLPGVPLPIKRPADTAQDTDSDSDELDPDEECLTGEAPSRVASRQGHTDA